MLFRHLSLTVTSGQLLWVRGPNGQGKSSLLRLLAGLSHPDDGQISRTTPIVYMGHQHALKDDLTAQEALGFLVRLHGGDADESALLPALARLGVQNRRGALVRTLSQGQRRRVALARLLLSQPGALWILDEPFDALDDEGIEVVNALIQSHRASGGAVLLTSHQALSLPAITVLDLAHEVAS